MVASILASTAILISSAISALAANAEKLVPIVAFIVGGKNFTLTMLKLLALIAIFFAAFFCFKQNMRYLNHVNYLINAAKGAETVGGPYSDVVTPDFVYRVFERAMNYQTMGNRCFYLAFPFLFWIFGPIPMAVCTLALLPLLRVLDTSFVGPNDTRLPPNQDSHLLQHRGV